MITQLGVWSASSNGIAWSPDGRRMYFIDSATQGIDVFGFHVGTGSAGHRRRLVTIERAHGVPDGMTTDNQGNLWVACCADQRMPSEVARLTAEEREVTPSFI